MRIGTEALVGLAGGALLTLALVATSRVEVGTAPDVSLLRLDLRLERASVEVCRERTEAELEALPVHMRRPTLCEPVPVVWQLEIDLDGRPLVREALEPGGMRRDRPATFDLEMEMPPGRADLAVRLEPVPPEPDATGARGVELEAALADLPRPRLEQTVRFTPGRLVVLRLGAETEGFRLIGQRDDDV